MQIKTRFSPRTEVVTLRFRPESVKAFSKFCKEHGMPKTEMADLLFMWLGTNGNKIMKELRKLQENDYPKK